LEGRQLDEGIVENGWRGKLIETKRNNEKKLSLKRSKEEDLESSLKRIGWLSKPTLLCFPNGIG
jgi:hypothetical protein